MRKLASEKSPKGTFTCFISDDGLKLFLTVEEPNGAFREAELLTFLQPYAAEDLLHQDVIKDITAKLNKGEAVTERRVAKGSAAEPGRDGKVVYLVKRFGDPSEVQVDDSGRALFAERQLFENIEAGRIVARIYPPTSGSAGRDVSGKPVAPTAGVPVKIQLGNTITRGPAENAEVSYEILTATCDGYLLESGGKLEVKNELVVPGDLDLGFGNIDFIGSVTVKGDVSTGYRVKAKTGVTINGSVRSGTVECESGDVTVKGDIFNAEAGRVISGGGVSARSYQEAQVEAVGTIRIEKSSLHSTLRSQSGMLSPNGRLIGGTTFVVAGLEVKQLGSPEGVQTVVVLCSTVETTTEYTQLKARLDEHTKVIELLSLHLGPLATNPARIQLLNPEHRKKMTALFEKLGKVKKSEEILLRRRAELIADHAPPEDARVNVVGTGYNGVLVRSHDQEYALVDTLKGPASIRFIEESKEFAVEEYAALNFHEEQKNE